jgi:predicted lysophospholipase L1 biosynthesis ABC-type transport system permease subunit
MKNIRLYIPIMFVLLAVTMSSCELIGDIFEAGMWTAVIVIALVVLLIGWIFRKIRR